MRDWKRNEENENGEGYQMICQAAKLFLRKILLIGKICIFSALLENCKVWLLEWGMLSDRIVASGCFLLLPFLSLLFAAFSCNFSLPSHSSLCFLCQTPKYRLNCRTMTRQNGKIASVAWQNTRNGHALQNDNCFHSVLQHNNFPDHANYIKPRT